MTFFVALVNCLYKNLGIDQKGISCDFSITQSTNMVKSIFILGLCVGMVLSAPRPGVVGVLPLAARSIHPAPFALPAVSAPLVAAAVPAVHAARIAAVATAHSSQAVARTYNAALAVPAAVPAVLPAAFHAAYSYSAPLVAPGLTAVAPAATYIL